MGTRRTPLVGAFGGLGLALLLAASASGAAGELSTAEARRHVGERATVCGRVESSHYAATSRGRPTFLDLDQPYPDQPFTVVIWGTDRPKFSPPPEHHFLDRTVCVTGKISSYRGVPQIVVDEPSQIETRLENIHRPPPSPSARTPRDCIPRSHCCRVCGKGKACGDSCINRQLTCHRGRGCACDRSEICG